MYYRNFETESLKSLMYFLRSENQIPRGLDVGIKYPLIFYNGHQIFYIGIHRPNLGYLTVPWGLDGEINT